VIRDQMEETRSSLADKLEALESKVTETVQAASDTVSSAVEGAKEVTEKVTETVSGTVETVKEAVSGTVESVKNALNFGGIVEAHPWASFGAAVAAGFCAAQLLGSSSSSSAQASNAVPTSNYNPPPPQPAPSYTPPPASATPASHQGQHKEEGWLETGEKWLEQLGMDQAWKTAGTTLRGLAIGTMMSLVRDLVSDTVPKDWQGELTKMVDDITTQLGGKVQKSRPREQQPQGHSSTSSGDGQHGQQSHGHTPAATGGSQHGQPTGSGTGYSGPRSTF